MATLKELFALVEAPSVPIDLKDIVQFFPGQHGQTLTKLWGKSHLTWHKDRFFVNGAPGPAYTRAEAAAKKYISRGYKTDCMLNVEVGKDFYELNFNVEFSDEHSTDPQECYIGFDPITDKLYIGFDAYVTEDEFNKAFDAAFKKTKDQEHNMNDLDHQKVFDTARYEYKKLHMGFWGLMFEITHKGGEYTAEEAMGPAPNGFYKGQFKQFKVSHANVIDVRLQ